MLKAYHEDNHHLVETPIEAADGIVWIDLFDPSIEEEQAVEKLLGIEIPTKDEIHDIEISSSLYQENNAIYMTASLVIQADTIDPEIHRVSFILVAGLLVTLRYVEPKSFRQFTIKAFSVAGDYQNGSKILIEILETIIGRCADALENAAHMIDAVNKTIFHANALPEKSFEASPVDFKFILQRLGGIGDLVSKGSESLVSLARLVTYLDQTRFFRDQPDDKHRMDVILKDLLSLRDYTTFLSEKLTFVLDATLGMISIEQNDIIKIFSVAAVLFMPPTLIASIYGMNFHHMPELQMPFGYPFAIGLMAVAAWLPYRFFKKRNWL